jgi:hypothetical protein
LGVTCYLSKHFRCHIVEDRRPDEAAARPVRLLVSGINPVSQSGLLIRVVQSAQFHILNYLFAFQDYNRFLK